MKTLKIIYLSFLAIILASCEKEPLNPDEDLAPKTVNEKVNANTKINESDLPPAGFREFRLYTSPEELQNDCNELATDWISPWDVSIGVGHTLNLYGMHYFGGYLYATGEEKVVDVEIHDDIWETVYHAEILVSSEPVYFGIASKYPMGVGYIYTDYNIGEDVYLTNYNYGDCNYNLEIDADGDGVPDNEDLMPNSNMEETVVIENCDSSVENIALGEGYMLSDKIDELEAGDYKNHGQYVKATAHYLNSLVEEGVITYEEKDMIMNCAGSSSIGK